MDKTDLISKLTEREKEALRHWLDRKTAKEIAQEIGISHHAVEKRLKMARTKLDASSSLEAARILENAERYDQMVAASPDLSHMAAALHSPADEATQSASSNWRYAMFAAFTLSLGVMVIGSQATQTIDAETVAEGLEKSISAEVAAARESFAELDTDGSGKVEREEFISPTSHLVMDNNEAEDPPLYFKADGGTVTPLEGDELEQVFVTLDDAGTRDRRVAMFDLMDGNGDDVLNEDEYTSAHLDGIAPRTFTIELPPEGG